MFRYPAKIEWRTLESLRLNQNEDFYLLKLHALIEQVSERK
jgi:hypothetical protein